MGTDEKTCSGCKKDLPLTAFSLLRSSKDGRNCYCILCARQKARDWRAHNPDQARKNSERWRRKNPSYAVEWQRKNPDKHLAANQRYRDNNIVSLKPHDLMLKACSECKLKLPLSEFWVESNKRDGRASCCARCSVLRRVEKKFGISPEVFGLMWDKQNGLCAVCDDVLKTRGRHSYAIDHDHSTGIVRAILCAHCNLGLGHFRDNPSICLAAASYLRLHKERAA